MTLKHLCAMSAFVGLVGASLPWVAIADPTTGQQNGVAFVTGGVGDSETQAIKAMMADYPLALTFAADDHGHADFMANVSVNIRTASGATVLEVTTTGPYLLARLAPGHYDITASHAGQTVKRHVHVGTAPNSVVIEWPAGQ